MILKIKPAIETVVVDRSYQFFHVVAILYIKKLKKTKQKSEREQTESYILQLFNYSKRISEGENNFLVLVLLSSVSHQIM